MAGIIDFIPMVQEWQFRRLMDKIIYQHYEIVKQFPGFYTSAYRIRADGIDWVDVEKLHPLIIKTMGRADLQYHHDMFFRQPHRAIQVPFKGNVLVVGFWCDNITDFEKWLKEQMPDVHTDYTSARVLIGQIPVDAPTRTTAHEHKSGTVDTSD